MKPANSKQATISACENKRMKRRRIRRRKLTPQDGFPENGRAHGVRSTARALNLSEAETRRAEESALMKLGGLFDGHNERECYLIGLMLEAHLLRESRPQVEMCLVETPETVTDAIRKLSHEHKLGLTG